jgi:hypothetical protein
MGLDDGDDGTAARMASLRLQGKAPATQPPEEALRAYGLRSIGGLLARVTRPGFRRRSPAAVQIMMDWQAIMGPDLGARTVPQKLSAGTLTIACAGPAAMELQHLAPQIIARINGHVGGHGDSAPIQRLRFVQQAVGLPDRMGPRPNRPRPTAERPPPIDLEPGPLRDALVRLAAAIQDRRE